MDNRIQDITHKAIKGIKWVFLATILSKAFQPVVTVILARLLLPEDFGVMAAATIVISFMGLFQDIGLGPALMQLKDRVREAASVVFWINLILGIIWCVLIFFSAPYIALFFGNADVTNILRVLGFSFVISPFASVQLILLSKELDFKKLFYFDIIPAIFPGVISIFLAYLGYGVWALVYGFLSSNILRVLALWYLNDWRPDIRCNTNVLKRLLTFGSYVSIETIELWVLTTIDNILVGRFLNITQLGIYGMGFNVAFLLPKNILTPMSRLLFPTLSKLQNNMADIRRIFLKVIKLNALISFPSALFLILYSDRFVPLFFGDKWVQAIPIIILLAPYGMISSIVGFSTTVYRSIGRPDIMPKFYLARLFVSVPAYYFAVQKGLITFCIVQLILVCLFAPINFYIALKVLNIKSAIIIELFKDVVICCLISVSIGYLLTSYLSSVYSIGDIAILAIFISVFMLLYILLLQLVGRSTYAEIKNILRVAMT